MTSIKIGIADDHKLFRKGLVELLNDMKHFDVILEAEDGKDLIQKVAHSPVEILLLDLKMPIMDGMEATKILKEKYPDIKIVILSMLDDEKFILHLIKLGVHGYLLKNTEPTELEATLLEVHEKGMSFNAKATSVMFKGLNKEHVEPSLGGVKLTDREKEILQLICEEHTNNEIAEKIFLSPRTVEGYRQKLIEKLGLKNTAGLVAFAYKNKLI